VGKQVHWFYQSTEGTQGPVPLEFLKNRLEQGKIPPETVVWMEGFEHERAHLSDALKTHDAPLYTLFDLFQSVKRKKVDFPTQDTAKPESNARFWMTLTRPALPLIALLLVIFFYFQAQDTPSPLLSTPSPTRTLAPIATAPTPQSTPTLLPQDH
jgi:hypothetical protein